MRNMQISSRAAIQMYDMEILKPYIRQYTSELGTDSFAGCCTLKHRVCFILHKKS